MIRFTGYKNRKQYPENLRRVVFYDRDGNRTFVFYTNNMEVKAEDIALLYKHRWSVELFFKWMRQHLRIKEFYGTTENAIKIQIYAAVVAYCMVAIVEADMKLNMTTYDLLRILQTALLLKIPLRDLLDKSNWARMPNEVDAQLTFDFWEEMTKCQG